MQMETKKVLHKGEPTIWQQRLASVLKLCMIVYVIGMLGLFPLYYQDKYFNMGEAKYLFVKNFSLWVFGITLLVWTVKLLLRIPDLKTTKWNFQAGGWKQYLKKISSTDYFVIAYGLSVLVSYCITPYKTQGFWGYSGWYMGFCSQLLFFLIYFFVSRYLKWENFLMLPILVSSFIVFLLAILHRFQIDPLNMYEGVSESQFILFLTTIGQATWYSSYLCIIFPIGLFLFWQRKNKIARLILGVYVCVGCGTIVTQNSDSAFIALILMLFVLFCFSFRSNEKWKHFMQILIMTLASFQVIGILQIAFPQKAMPLEKLSIFFSQSPWITAMLAVVIILYAAFLLWERKKAGSIRFFAIVPKITAIVVVIVLCLSILLVYLTTTDKIPAGLSFLKETNYFNFNEAWGNGRGFSWQISAQIFGEFPVINKLFGCGPDCFAPYAYDHYRDVLVSHWGDTVLTNAHNEWLTSFLFFGLIGGISYLGIFVSQIIRSVKYQRNNRILIAITMCIAAYMGHNLFCYQQIVCTPIIFILIGLGEGFIRRSERVRESKDAL